MKTTVLLLIAMVVPCLGQTESQNKSQPGQISSQNGQPEPIIDGNNDQNGEDEDSTINPTTVDDGIRATTAFHHNDSVSNVVSPEDEDYDYFAPDPPTYARPNQQGTPSLPLTTLTTPSPTDLNIISDKSAVLLTTETSTSETAPIIPNELPKLSSRGSLKPFDLNNGEHPDADQIISWAARLPGVYEKDEIIEDIFSKDNSSATDIPFVNKPLDINGQNDKPIVDFENVKIPDVGVPIVNRVMDSVDSVEKQEQTEQNVNTKQKVPTVLTLLETNFAGFDALFPKRNEKPIPININKTESVVDSLKTETRVGTDPQTPEVIKPVIELVNDTPFVNNNKPLDINGQNDKPIVDFENVKIPDVGVPIVNRVMDSVDAVEKQEQTEQNVNTKQKVPTVLTLLETNFAGFDALFPKRNEKPIPININKTETVVDSLKTESVVDSLKTETRVGTGPQTPEVIKPVIELVNDTPDDNSNENQKAPTILTLTPTNSAQIVPSIQNEKTNSEPNTKVQTTSDEDTKSEENPNIVFQTPNVPTFVNPKLKQNYTVTSSFKIKTSDVVVTKFDKESANPAVLVEPTPAQVNLTGQEIIPPIKVLPNKPPQLDKEKDQGSNLPKPPNFNFYSQQKRPTDSGDRKDEEQTCGVVTNRIDSVRILGKTTLDGQWPWQVAIYQTRPKDQYTCSGTLVTRRHIITAAHCVQQQRYPRHAPWNRYNHHHHPFHHHEDGFMIRLGKRNLVLDSKGSQTRFSSKTTIHPSVNVAILELDHPVEYTDWVRPVCLGSNDTGSENVTKLLGSMTGWGYDGTVLREELSELQVTVVDQDTCAALLPDAELDENTYCAQWKHDAQCLQDSGNGMVYRKEDTWYLRGVSTSKASTPCATSRSLTFTDLTQVQLWISENTKDVFRNYWHRFRPHMGFF